jgi:hypothetical protein
MRPPLLTCLLALLPLSAPAQTADTIMARVASNQDASQSDRAHYVYVQHAHIASRKGKTVRCEETTDTRITPTGDTSTQQLVKLDGRLLKKGTYLTYTELPKDSSGHSNIDADHKDLSITAQDSDDDPMDQDLVENLRKNLTARHSRDGISPNLFPLTSKEQADYQYRLLGRAPMNGRDCFHIAFSPKDRDDYGWKGDAYIDATAFQPVLIRTAMARKIPLAVRLLLGTNVPGLGFTILYAPQPPDQPDAVWFPVSFGTEFKLHVLFFLSRQVTFTADNRDFEKTHVNSHIVDRPSTAESSPPDTPATPSSQSSPPDIAHPQP